MIHAEVVANPDGAAAFVKPLEHDTPFGFAYEHAIGAMAALFGFNTMLNAGGVRAIVIESIVKSVTDACVTGVVRVSFSCADEDHTRSDQIRSNSSVNRRVM